MKKGWIFLLIFVLCIGVLVYGYADTMTELKTHVNPAPQVGDEPGLAMAALEDALGKRSYPDDYAGMYIDGASLVVMLTVFRTRRKPNIASLPEAMPAAFPSAKQNIPTKRFKTRCKLPNRT